MGPILICDKSTLHGLSTAELNQLRRNYSLNIPPVLLMEVLADLKKAEDLAAGSAEVQHLANKLVPACSAVNVGFRDLVFSEIRGRNVTADGRPILQAGECVISQGKKGMIMEQSVYDEALLRWQQGSFLDAEKLLAEKWRRTSKAIDLEGVQRLLRSRYSRHVKLKSLNEAAHLVDGLLRSASPRQLLLWFLNDCEILPDNLQEALGRIESNAQFSLAADLPYTTCCLRLALIFHFGLAFGLISTRPTNRIDLEYLYYVPFCMVFSSGDTLHRDLVSFVCRNDQLFIERDAFKADLKGLVIWWNSLDAQQKEQERHFSGPPEFESSLTYQAWKKFMKPGYRERAKSQQPAKKDGRNVVRHLQELIKGATPSCDPDIPLDECDFVVRKHNVRINGPCICGSEKAFKDCCGREIVAELARKH